MRNWFYDNEIEKNAFFINCGLGGNCAIMAPDLLEDEGFFWKSDYCFIHYGVNDLGAWLYDPSEEESAELIEKRKKRDEAFFKGIKETV